MTFSATEATTKRWKADAEDQSGINIRGILDDPIFQASRCFVDQDQEQASDIDIVGWLVRLQGPAVRFLQKLAG